MAPIEPELVAQVVDDAAAVLGMNNKKAASFSKTAGPILTLDAFARQERIFPELPAESQQDEVVGLVVGRYREWHQDRQTHLMNPYKMHIDDIIHDDYKQAFLYDEDLSPHNNTLQLKHSNPKLNGGYEIVNTVAGFEIPASHAKKVERMHIYQIRKKIDRNYRRYEDDSDKNIHEIPIGGSHIILTKTQPSSNADVGEAILRGEHSAGPAASVSGCSADDPDYIPKTFTLPMGQLISQTRNQLNLTQRQLAMKCNIDVNTIANIERGGLITFNPQSDLVRSLANALELSTIPYME